MYWFAILIGVLAVPFTVPQSDHMDTYLEAIKASFMLPAFTATSSAPGNEITQTVAVECVLYALYPIGWMIWRRYSLVPIITISALIYLINAVLVGVWGSPQWMGRNVACCGLYWYFGASAASVASKVTQSKWASFSMCCLFYLLYLGICHGLDIKGGHYLKTAFLAFLAAQVMVMVACYERAMSLPLRNTPVMALLIGLGTISYSLYVCHLPVIEVMASVRLFQYWNPSLWIVAATLASLIVAIMVYFMIERPSHMWAKRALR